MFVCIPDYTLFHFYPRFALLSNAKICLTSNVMSMTTVTVADSHLRFWREKMVPICICTDDKGLMGCDLSGEFRKASEAFNLSIDDLRRMSKDALEMSFLDKSSVEYKQLDELLARC
ncbi:hypothetical protein TELCIR_11186 [Teladorsagia circumcincta]|uniref:Adenosine deaminase domain-containing protein n=1 Tax=Teladorsagia circumcincta TaxID=45464 RepID=A0A2G9UA45_TELCI|nr:hypothetical protein TELCIR_11186 [Teladorsagia circumcincta]